MTHLKHVTADGERWDLLSQRYYGSIDGQQRLIEANRDLWPGRKVPAVLYAGLELVVPLVERSVMVARERLPPWKR